VLITLGFLPKNHLIAEVDVDKKYCQDLWTLVRGDDIGGVSWETLRIVLLNFIGIKTPEHEKQMENERHATEGDQMEKSKESVGDEAAEKPNDMTQLALFEDGTFYLKKGSHRRLFAHFKSLYVHRVQYVGLYQKKNKDYVDSASYLQAKPQISDKTNKLAENRRKKMLGEGNENVSLVQILLIPKHNEEQMEARRKELMEKEVDGCTFKPKTLDY
jgi:hypothetical protein